MLIQSESTPTIVGATLTLRCDDGTQVCIVFPEWYAVALAELRGEVVTVEVIRDEV